MGGQSHTPGPWYTKPTSPSGVEIEIRSNGSLIGYVHDNPTVNGAHKANARLIAAAPCMADHGAFLLARLAEFEQTMESESGDAAVRDWHGHVAPALARFRAALRKATGEGEQ